MGDKDIYGDLNCCADSVFVNGIHLHKGQPLDNLCCIPFQSVRSFEKGFNPSEAAYDFNSQGIEHILSRQNDPCRTQSVL